MTTREDINELQEWLRELDRRMEHFQEEIRNLQKRLAQLDEGPDTENN